MFITVKEISLYNFKEHSIFLENLTTDVNIIKYHLLFDNNAHCMLYCCISGERKVAGLCFS